MNVHHVLGEREQLGTTGDQRLERSRIAGVVAGLHVVVGVNGRSLHNRLVFGRQAVPSFFVDVQVQLRTAFPPAWVSVILSHFVEAQLQIVVRTDPLGLIDRAFFQGLVNFATRNVLGHATNALDHFAGETADAELGALEVFQRFDRLAEPAAHLGTGVAHREVHDAVVAVELTE